jgi:hypothetical protein
MESYLLRRYFRSRHEGSLHGLVRGRIIRILCRGGAMGLADAVDRDRLVRTFLELVAIDSPTGHEEGIGRSWRRASATSAAR